jgi:flagellar biosynthesis protein FlhA
MDWRQWLLPASLIACVAVLIVPVPAALLDILLAGNIALAVIILLTVLNVRSPLEFSLFPSVLLAATLGRLVLNISATRIILSHGADGVGAAGNIIESFGSYVGGQNLVIGAILFSIIIIVQFVVVTKGATRVSEVAARFALDGMPGRQMAIDADLSGGLIDHTEANRRREELNQQADFYGAMDGASKFVRGDAVAAIIIIFINIGGGLLIGLSQNMSLGQAADTFTRLTIGEGLSCQIPAFLISMATGILLTRNTQSFNFQSVFCGSCLDDRPCWRWPASFWRCWCSLGSLPCRY